MIFTEWNFLDPEELNENLDIEKWKTISYKYPPSFYVVWVLIGNKKKKAYLDSPNRRWVADTRNVWDDKELENVKAWKEITHNSFEKQKENAIL